MGYTARVKQDSTLTFISGGITSAINTTDTLAVPNNANYVVIGGNTAAITFNLYETADANDFPLAATASIALDVTPGMSIYLYSAGTGKAVYQFFRKTYNSLPKYTI